MLQIKQKLELVDAAAAEASLTLPFELRSKSRLRTHLDDGLEVGLMLPRGTVLRHGELLKAENGLVVKVQAAQEPVSMVASGDPQLLARACYHLGNRHVAVQIQGASVCYLRDHVLDEMVRGLGLDVTHGVTTFEPEVGAYAHQEHHHHA